MDWEFVVGLSANLLFWWCVFYSVGIHGLYHYVNSEPSKICLLCKLQGEGK